MRTLMLAAVAVALSTTGAAAYTWDDEARAWSDLCEHGPVLTREWACGEAERAEITRQIMRDSLGQTTARELEERAHLEDELCAHQGGVAVVPDWDTVDSDPCREAKRLRERARTR